MSTSDDFYAANPRPAPDAPREEHFAYANKWGFFWLPCPRCGRWTGGHEGSQGSIEFWRSEDGSESAAHSTCCPDDGKPVDLARIRAMKIARGDTEEEMARGEYQLGDEFTDKERT